MENDDRISCYAVREWAAPMSVEKPVLVRSVSNG